MDWAGATGDLIAKIFNGDDDSINILTEFFANGKFLPNNVTPMSDPEIQGIMGKALYSQIIPMIWRMGGTPSVYVMDALQDCNAVLSTDEVKSDVAAQTKACVNGKAYYLVNAVGAEAIYIKDPFYGAMIRGMQWPFTMPSGVDKLDGTQWGGLTVAQIIQG